MKRVLTVALSLFLLFGTFAVPTIAAEDEGPVIVLAGSDFQAGSEEASSSNVRSIISAIKSDGYSKIDGFIFGGDYDTEYDEKTDEIKALKDTVKGEYSSLDENKMIFVQGNHDPAESVGLSKSGANDTDDYGVFVINEDDYMWYNNDEARVKQTAAALESYLSQKANNNYKKPIFVTSHLSLNYSKRTYNDGDGKYAKYIFDVLNNYGKKMNIIFLFGHDHNNVYDNYIGGSTVYLTKGDSIFISKLGDQTATPDKYTLNFTYMNYGYVSAAYCLNNELTMTVFEIENDIVTVKRYNQSGIVSLKTKGEWASSLSETAGFYGTDDSYLNTSYSGLDYIGNEYSDKGFSLLASGITGINVTKTTAVKEPDFQTAYADYDVEIAGAVEGGAIVKIKLDDAFDTSKPVIVRNTVSGTTSIHQIQDGRIVFYTEDSITFEIYQTASVLISSQKTVIYKPVSQFVDGKDTIIVSKNAKGEAYALKNTADNKIAAEKIEIKSGYGGLYIGTVDESVVWEFTHDADFGYAAVIGDLKNKSTGKYLAAAGGNTLSGVTDTEEEYTAWRIASNNFGMYTLPNDHTYDRYYVKYNDGFNVSLTEDGEHRVYLFVAEEITANVAAYPGTLQGQCEVNPTLNTKIGTKLYLVYDNGEITTVDATVSMLKDKNGKAVDFSIPGKYENLSIYYNGILVCNGYTLEARDPIISIGAGYTPSHTNYWKQDWCQTSTVLTALTNGVNGTFNFYDAECVAWSNGDWTSPLSIVLELDEEYSVSEIAAYAITCYDGSGITAPATFTVAYSLDGENWTTIQTATVKTVTPGKDGWGNDADSVLYTITLEEPIIAKYIQYRFVDGYFAFLSEIEAYGKLASDVPDPEQPPVDDVLLGDVNSDGVIDMFDYLLVKSFYFEVTIPTDDQFIRADMNEDGVIDMFDYLMVKTAYFNS